MKKRSLVSAVAMLIVSAIVLTSATYAWFASNTNASVETFSASVGNAAGSIYISATGAKNSWQSTLSPTDFAQADASQNGIATSLSPVSYDKTGDHFYGGSFTENNGDGKFINFVGTADANTSYYTKITVWVYTETAGTVTVTPTLTRGVPYVYGSLKSGNQQIILGASDDSYYPIVLDTNATEGTATDNNPQNGIIDDDEATAGTDLGLGTQVTVDNGSITLNMTAGETNKKSIDVYVWAEGQDSNCFGTSSGTATFHLDFSFVASTTAA